MTVQPIAQPSSRGDGGAAARNDISLSQLYVVGGQQRHARTMRENEPGWYKYQRGLILNVDASSGAVTRQAGYVSPPDVCADEDPAVLFKSGTLEDDRIYVCTQTEILIYTVPDFRLESYVSLPCFNDVHHVRRSRDGHLLVANSGLDMVLEMTHAGEVLREWHTLGDDPWSIFSREVDYRRVASTKPHRSHPNQVFYIGDEIWVTRFEQRDAICLTDPSKRIAIDLELVHDGFVHNGFVYFTTVNGCVVIVDTKSLAVEEIVDLNSLNQEEAHLGWCRGILVEGDLAWVGFTRLRLTKFRQNLSWVRWGFKTHLPTRVACFDLANKRFIREIDLQAHGLDAVFSIFPARAKRLSS
jgi:hypothetical protein